MSKIIITVAIDETKKSKTFMVDEVDHKILSEFNDAKKTNNLSKIIELISLVKLELEKESINDAIRGMQTFLKETICEKFNVPIKNSLATRTTSKKHYTIYENGKSIASFLNSAQLNRMLNGLPVDGKTPSHLGRNAETILKNAISKYGAENVIVSSAD